MQNCERHETNDRGSHGSKNNCLQDRHGMMNWHFRNTASRQKYLICLKYSAGYVNSTWQQCAVKEKAERLKNYTNFNKVPEKSFENLVRFGVVIDEIIVEYGLDTLALRCWIEMEKEFGVAPCVLLSELNDRGFPAACELDICNAITMYALAWHPVNRLPAWTGIITTGMILINAFSSIAVQCLKV